MAGKKYDTAGLKGTTGGNRHEDRFSTVKNVFEPITIDTKNALTVIYMLQSPEDSVVTKAIASLEVFASKAPDNLKLLSSLGIFQYLFPLIRHTDRVVKRFSHKLMGMLCSLEEFRKVVLKIDDILNTLVDILTLESDEVVQEYVALSLAELSCECHAASELLKVGNCVETLFLRIQSFDPDVQKNCLEVMHHLLNDINGLDVFIQSPVFDIKLLLDLTFSSYPSIQNLALEVLKQFTTGSRDPSVLLAFRDAQGLETVMSILENDEWLDLYESASDLLVNVVENPTLCDYILQSSYLGKLMKLLDNVANESVVLKIIGILAKMTQTFKGRKALHIIEMDKRFGRYLIEGSERVKEFSCYAIANLAQYFPCLDNILEENPIDSLLDFVNDRDRIYCLRNMASYALSVLCSEDRRASEAFLNNEKKNDFISLLNDISEETVELCQNIVQTFTSISLDVRLRNRLINEDFFAALFGALNNQNITFDKSQPLQVDILECLSNLLVEEEARSLFVAVEGGKTLMNCLHSKFASVKEWAAHVVIIMAQNEAFIRFFISEKGLQCMLKMKNTLYTLPSWQSALEAIFRQNLSAKFAHLGRLDFQDITNSGFFVCLNYCWPFVLLDEFFLTKCNPIKPIYFVNFSTENLYPPKKIHTPQTENEDGKAVAANQEESKPSQTQNVQNYMKGADRNSLEEYVWDGTVNSYTTIASKKSNVEKIGMLDDFFVDTLDPYLSEYVIRLKQKIEKAESETLGEKEWWCMHPQLVAERARIIAEFVAGEMSGPNVDFSCLSKYKLMHIDELKYYMGTNIIPLGFLRIGDYFERALLFKVLADRIGFPCALVRGFRGKAWVEIALPVINLEKFGNDSSYELSNSSNLSNEVEGEEEREGEYETETTSILSCGEQEESYTFPKVRMECFKPFPKYLLKPNTVVDLVHVPGRLLKINSFEAKAYCGLVNV